MRLSAKMYVFMFCSAVAFAEQTHEALTVKPVSRETTVIAEKTLLANNAIANKTAAVMSGPRSLEVRGIGQPSKGIAAVEDLDRTEQPNGSALYGFELEPGERIRINKSGQGESFSAMKVMEPLQANAMTPEIKRVNRMPRPLRTKRIELVNRLEEPFKLVLMVYGNVGYPYQLEIERTSRKKM